MFPFVSPAQAEGRFIGEEKKQHRLDLFAKEIISFIGFLKKREEDQKKRRKKTTLRTLNGKPNHHSLCEQR